MKPVLKLAFITILLSCTSCIVNAPKFTTIEKVLVLQMGMSQEEVSQQLGIPPYNFIFKSDTETVLLYKYRVSDRTTLPFLLGPANGKKIRGRYVNLMITYDKAGLVKKMTSCNDCDATIVEEKQLDVNKIITLLTVTLPVVLVFVGIKINTK